MSGHVSRRQMIAGMVATGVSAPILPAFAADREVKLAYNKFASLFQFFAAKEQGFFQAAGLKLVDSFVPPPLAIPGLLSGQHDVAFQNILDIAQINLKGGKVKIIHAGTMLSPENPYTQLLVPTGSQLKTAKEFEGGKIAVPFVRSTLDLDLIAWLVANGADPKKVSIVGVGIDGVIPAIQSKQFEGVYAIEPAVSVIIAQNLGHQIAFPASASVSGYMVTAFIAREEWVEKNPEIAKAVVEVLDKSTDWLTANPNEIPDLVSRNTGIEPALAAKMIHPRPLRVARKADMQPFLDVAAKFGHIPSQIDACSMLASVCPKEC
jgi:NitT/TauT family transport system substrate-binding protein